MTYEELIANSAPIGGITLSDLENAMYSYIEHEEIEEGGDEYNRLLIALSRLKGIYTKGGVYSDSLGSSDLYTIINAMRGGGSKDAMYTIVSEAVQQKIQEAADASNGMPLGLLRGKEEGSESDAETEAETEENSGVGKIVLIAIAIVLLFLLIRR